VVGTTATTRSSRRLWIRGLTLAFAVAVLSSLAASSAARATVAATGTLRAEVSEDPWRLSFVGSGRDPVVSEHPGTGPGPLGTLGFRSQGVWRHATRVLSSRREGRAYVAELATTDPLRRIDVRLEAAGEGVIELDARVIGPTADLEAIGIGFGARPAERYFGFGERSNAVDQRGNVVENHVADGPYQTAEYPLIEAFVPDWGVRPRDDSTYYPVPWLLSSAGYGVLVDNPQTSYFRLDHGGGWSVEVVKAPPDELAPASAPAPARLSMRFFAGPKPADALERFTRETGRQPPPAAPWLFGPWVQPNGDLASQLQLLGRLQDADAPLSVSQTYLHYLPCGDQVGGRDAERARVGAMHQRGLAVTTYANPMICASYQPVFSEAAARGGLIENSSGDAYLFQYSTDTSFDVAEFDFTTAAGRELFSSVLEEAVADGHDGWMEDFGEYTPLDSRTHSGISGTVVHNLYPRQYHCAASEAFASTGRPLVRFQRSGWTGTAPCAQVVWGGDPTTAWGFDGLGSAVRQALGIGLSGISTWGSDIGGFFAIGANHLSPELLVRWVQFGAVSGVMRTQANGIAVPAKPRPQVWDPDQLANWRRYAKLRTQLYPYLVAADVAYRRTGVPIMRHLALAYPHDSRASVQDEQFLFGPDLLAAPVIEPGARERELYLPEGQWVDLWRSVDYEQATGGLRLGSPRTVAGERSVTLPAPLEQLPLLARAGTLLPLLSRDVDTLADYGEAEGIVKLGDREDELELLAFPRGRSSAAFYEDERLSSREGNGRWTLVVDGSQVRDYILQASMTTLQEPFEPCQVRLGGHRLPASAWHYEAQRSALTAHFRTGSGRLVATERCEGPGGKG
jgi:alpha-glucosidase (family GH31 glycosyl hydrolase)